MVGVPPFSPCRDTTLDGSFPFFSIFVLPFPFLLIHIVIAV